MEKVTGGERDRGLLVLPDPRCQDGGGGRRQYYQYRLDLWPGGAVGVALSRSRGPAALLQIRGLSDHQRGGARVYTLSGCLLGSSRGPGECALPRRGRECAGCVLCGRICKAHTAWTAGGPKRLPGGAGVSRSGCLLLHDRRQPGDRWRVHDLVAIIQIIQKTRERE